MKEILKKAPCSSIKESLLTPIFVLAILRYYHLLGDFSKGPLLTVNLLTFLGQLLLFLIGFALVAIILRWGLVQDSPKMKIGTYIVVGILVLLVVLGYVGIGSFVQEGAFYLPAPWDSFLVFTLSLVISYLELERTDFSSLCQYDYCPSCGRFSASLLWVDGHFKCFSYKSYSFSCPLYWNLCLVPWV